MCRFERELREEMMRNARGQKAEKVTPCPLCNEPFKLPMEAVLFGGAVTCPHCEQTFNVGSDAADKIVSDLDDFRRNLGQ